MRLARAGVGGAGIGLAVFGAWRLMELGLDNLISTVWWLVAGVVAHDALLAPATLVIVVIAARVLPGWIRTPASVGFVVLGTVTVVAIPVLGRFGERADNPTLLDRDYLVGWLALAAVVGLGIAGTALRLRLRQPDPTRGTGP